MDWLKSSNGSSDKSNHIEAMCLVHYGEREIKCFSFFFSFIIFCFFFKYDFRINVSEVPFLNLYHIKILQIYENRKMFIFIRDKIKQITKKTKTKDGNRYVSLFYTYNASAYFQGKIILPDLHSHNNFYILLESRK